MVDFFDTAYTRILDKNKVLTQLRIYSLQRLFIRLISNLLVPLYYQFNTNKHWLYEQRREGERFIVTLTSFPARIDRLWIVIESILRQSLKPDKIILWLSEDQFPDFTQLPPNLRRQQDRGLEIRIEKGDLKSHKKYFYCMQEFPSDKLITIDDDIIYPTTLIADLVQYHQKFPDSICCHRAKKVTFESKSIKPYNNWIELKAEYGPAMDIFQTSGGGTLYPPGSLDAEVFNDQVFRKYCLFADDVWLNIMAQKIRTRVVKTNYYSVCLPVLNWNNIKLSTHNVDQGQNDSQLSQIVSFYKMRENRLFREH